MATVPRLTRDPATGRSITEYVDTVTGQVVPNGHLQVTQPNGFMTPADLGIDPLKEPTAPQNTGQEIIEETKPHSERDGGGFAAQSRADPRTQANNFGYIDKPSWAGFASALPGPLGLAGKVGNAAINASNMEAVSTAKQTMGVEDTSPMGKIKDTIRDNKGFVGDYSINNQNYAVGLEAVDPTGRTTLTPDEARNRGLTLGGIKATAADEAKAQRKQFAQDFPEAKPRGLLGNTMNSLKDFLGSIFDSDEDGYPDAPEKSTTSFADARKAGFGSASNLEGFGGFGSGRGASEKEADRGGGGVSSGGGGLW